MIVFDLECRAGGHRFEGWFGSSGDFERQREQQLLVCPLCGSADVGKAVMAPSIGRKGNQLPEPTSRQAAPAAASGAAPPVLSNAQASAGAKAPASLPPEAAALLRAMVQAQSEALKSSRWVGRDFAEEARAMHYGERDHAIIHGQTTPEEARDLLEEGVAVAPLLFPVIPPDQAH